MQEGPKFNLRKAGEGSDVDPKWKKATIYKKENEEEDDEEEEDVPLDLSNKGSTPGASPSMQIEPEEAEQHPMNLANYAQLPYNFPSSNMLSSSDEEDNTLLPVPAQCEICSKVFTKRSSFKRHMSDHKGTIACPHVDFASFYITIVIVRISLFLLLISLVQTSDRTSARAARRLSSTSTT